MERMWLWNDPATGYLERGVERDIPPGVKAYDLGGELVEVVPDIKGGFSASAGCEIGSRSARREYMKREGMRVVECVDAASALSDHASRQSESIRNPKVKLVDVVYETFQAAGGDRKDVRRMLEESERGGDPSMERRWKDGRVRG